MRIKHLLIFFVLLFLNVLLTRFLKFFFYYIKSSHPPVSIPLLGEFTDPSTAVVDGGDDSLKYETRTAHITDTETFYAAIFYPWFRVSYADTNVLSSNYRCFFSSLIYIDRLQRPKGVLRTNRPGFIPRPTHTRKRARMYFSNCFPFYTVRSRTPETFF